MGSMRLVIFDCDGVLVDSEPITNRMLAEELSASGLPMTRDQAIEMFVGGTIQSVFEKACALGAELPNDWVEGFYDRMVDTLRREIEIVPGVSFVLDVLDRHGIPYCVGSNGPMKKMEATLQKTGLWHRLNGRIYSAHDVGIAKPDPGLFLHAAQEMGFRPDETVVIEDSASGAKAAKAAGMRCYGYTKDTPEEKLTPHNVIPFHDMIELPQLLGLEQKGRG